MVKKTDFPNKLYVYIAEDDEQKYFICNESQRSCNSLDETRLIGIYHLEKVAKLLPAEGVMVEA